MAIAPSPIRTNRFTVEIGDFPLEGIRKVNVPASNTDRGTGSDEDTWGDTTFQDLEMERGVEPGDTLLYDWREAIVEGDEQSGLKTVAVTLRDSEWEPKIKWMFEDAWITYYEPPQLDAASDDIAMERVSIAYDSMERNDNP